jgi:hypothetical protein
VNVVSRIAVIDSSLLSGGAGIQQVITIRSKGRLFHRLEVLANYRDLRRNQAFSGGESCSSSMNSGLFLFRNAKIVDTIRDL